MYSVKTLQWYNDIIISNVQQRIKLQGVSFLPQFMICLWEVLNLIIYQRLRSHFFPEYGRFAFWTENLIKSQFYGPLWHLKVKCSILSFSPKLLKIKQKDKLYTNILSISWLLWKHNVFMKCQNLEIFNTVLKCFFFTSESKAIWFKGMIFWSII